MAHDLEKRMTVKLLSWTAYPVETIYLEWQASRTEGPIMDAARLADVVRSDPDPDGKLRKEIREVFEKVVAMKIPVSETISFVFLVENASISWREQAVRHRVGHRFGGQLGADLIPDVAESTWWAQTMRVKDMGRFYDLDAYRVPDSLKGAAGETVVEDMHAKGDVTEEKECTAAQLYYRTMHRIQDAYNTLCLAGVPVEDAREVIPLGAQHRLTWSMNLSSLMHVLSKRGCWIAQLGIWEPFIMGVVEELATKVDPYFRRLIDPPCIGPDGNYKACVFNLENENRLPSKHDPYPPCPLWIHNDYYFKNDRREEAAVGNRTQEYNARVEQYAKLWGRDPRTGERKQLA